MRVTIKRRFLPELVLMAVILLFSSSNVQAAASSVAMDGQFDDWEGKMNIADAAGDAVDSNGDVVNFSWANNPNDPAMYWMMERNPSANWVCYIVYLDANNNGQFHDHADRLVVVMYQPQNNRSRVKVAVRYADTGHLISNSRNNDWGESISEGGSKVEFSASFADLGMSVGQTVRMYAVSYTILHLLKQAISDIETIFNDEDKDEEHELQPPPPVDRIPDTGNVQWSPVPIMGYWALGAIVLGGGVIWYFNERRRCSPPR